MGNRPQKAGAGMIPASSLFFTASTCALQDAQLYVLQQKFDALYLLDYIFLIVGFGMGIAAGIRYGRKK